MDKYAEMLARMAWTVQYCDRCSRWTWFKDVTGKNFDRECMSCHAIIGKLKFGSEDDMRAIPDAFMVDGMTAICNLLKLEPDQWEIYQYSPALPTRKHGRYGLYVPGYLTGRVSTLLVNAHLIHYNQSRRFAANEDIQIHPMSKLAEWRAKRTTQS